MLGELKFDDSIFAVDVVLLDVAFAFAFLEEHVEHFGLDGLLHVLDDEFLALGDLAIDSSLTH